MKTNIIMASPDRELFGIKIQQQTQTGFLSLSDLQEAYTRARIQNDWNDKDISNIMNSKENIERMYYILEERDLLPILDIKTGINGFIENCNKIGVAKYLKQLGVYKTIGARQNKVTWCDPYLWVLIAMELSPLLYARVVLWLGDKLILNRIEAGNFYKGLARAISKFQNVDYIKMAKALNYKIFGRHETGIRNTATKDELRRLSDLEGKIAFAIDMGYIKSFNDCIKEIERVCI